ncbi:MAG: SRPBCC family protein [Anaerolineae bacterium]
MASLTKSIEVNVPVRTAYNQWTQFESFPQFMEGVKSVQQLDNKRLHWVAEVAGKEKQWDAVITDQVPDQKIAWRSTSGAQNDGIVTFQPLGADKTRVSLQIDYDPEGVVEETGDKLGFVSRRVEGDLERFKKFIESRGQETGAWRGTIKDAQVRSGQTGSQH